jgi:hypothetical protein
MSLPTSGRDEQAKRNQSGSEKTIQRNSRELIAQGIGIGNGSDREKLRGSAENSKSKTMVVEFENEYSI